MTEDLDVRRARDAARLRAVWDIERARRGPEMSQKAMALEFGWNPSNVTQYLNGHIALNVAAKLRFAKYLGKPVLEIWPDFEFASVAPGELPPEAVDIAARWVALDERSQQAVRALILSLSPTP